MRDHPKVKALAHKHGVGYDDAEDLLRGQAARDPEAAAAVREIDAARARERADALALSQDMAGRLGLDLDAVARLVDALAGDAELETWLARRVQLTRAHGRSFAADEHPVNL